MSGANPYVVDVAEGVEEEEREESGAAAVTVYNGGGDSGGSNGGSDGKGGGAVSTQEGGGVAGKVRGDGDVELSDGSHYDDGYNGYTDDGYNDDSHNDDWDDEDDDATASQREATPTRRSSPSGAGPTCAHRCRTYRYTCHHKCSRFWRWYCTCDTVGRPLPATADHECDRCAWVSAHVARALLSSLLWPIVLPLLLSMLANKVACPYEPACPGGDVDNATMTGHACFLSQGDFNHSVPATCQIITGNATGASPSLPSHRWSDLLQPRVNFTCSYEGTAPLYPPFSDWAMLPPFVDPTVALYGDQSLYRRRRARQLRRYRDRGSRRWTRRRRYLRQRQSRQREQRRRLAGNHSSSSSSSSSSSYRVFPFSHLLDDPEGFGEDAEEYGLNYSSFSLVFNRSHVATGCESDVPLTLSVPLLLYQYADGHNRPACDLSGNCTIAHLTAEMEEWAGPWTPVRENYTDWWMSNPYYINTENVCVEAVSSNEALVANHDLYAGDQYVAEPYRPPYGLRVDEEVPKGHTLWLTPTPWRYGSTTITVSATAFDDALARELLLEDQRATAVAQLEAELRAASRGGVGGINETALALAVHDWEEAYAARREAEQARLKYAQELAANITLEGGDPTAVLQSARPPPIPACERLAALRRRPALHNGTTVSFLANRSFVVRINESDCYGSVQLWPLDVNLARWLPDSWVFSDDKGGTDSSSGRVNGGGSNTTSNASAFSASPVSAAANVSSNLSALGHSFDGSDRAVVAFLPRWLFRDLSGFFYAASPLRPVIVSARSFPLLLPAAVFLPAALVLLTIMPMTDRLCVRKTVLLASGASCVLITLAIAFAAAGPADLPFTGLLTLALGIATACFGATLDAYLPLIASSDVELARSLALAPPKKRKKKKKSKRQIRKAEARKKARRKRKEEEAQERAERRARGEIIDSPPPSERSKTSSQQRQGQDIVRKPDKLLGVFRRAQDRLAGRSVLRGQQFALLWGLCTAAWVAWYADGPDTLPQLAEFVRMLFGTASVDAAKEEDELGYSPSNATGNTTASDARAPASAAATSPGNGTMNMSTTTAAARHSPTSPPSLLEAFLEAAPISPGALASLQFPYAVSSRVDYTPGLRWALLAIALASTCALLPSLCCLRFRWGADPGKTCAQWCCFNATWRRDRVYRPLLSAGQALTSAAGVVFLSPSLLLWSWTRTLIFFQHQRFLPQLSWCLLYLALCSGARASFGSVAFVLAQRVGRVPAVHLVGGGVASGLCSILAVGLNVRWQRLQKKAEDWNSADIVRFTTFLMLCFYCMYFVRGSVPVLRSFGFGGGLLRSVGEWYCVCALYGFTRGPLDTYTRSVFADTLPLGYEGLGFGFAETSTLVLNLVGPAALAQIADDHVRARRVARQQSSGADTAAVVDVLEFYVPAEDDDAGMEALGPFFALPFFLLVAAAAIWVFRLDLKKARRDTHLYRPRVKQLSDRREEMRTALRERFRRNRRAEEAAWRDKSEELAAVLEPLEDFSGYELSTERKYTRVRRLLQRRMALPFQVTLGTRRIPGPFPCEWQRVPRTYYFGWSCAEWRCWRAIIRRRRRQQEVDKAEALLASWKKDEAIVGKMLLLSVYTDIVAQRNWHTLRRRPNWVDRHFHKGDAFPSIVQKECERREAAFAEKKRLAAEEEAARQAQWALEEDEDWLFAEGPSRATLEMWAPDLREKGSENSSSSGGSSGGGGGSSSDEPGDDEEEDR